MVVDVIVFQVPKTPTLSLYIWQTAEWIEMKLIPIGSSSKNLHNSCRLFSRHVAPSWRIDVTKFLLYPLFLLLLLFRQLSCTVSEKLLLGLQRNFVYVFHTEFLVADKINFWPWPMTLTLTCLLLFDPYLAYLLTFYRSDSFI